MIFYLATELSVQKRIGIVHQRTATTQGLVTVHVVEPYATIPSHLFHTVSINSKLLRNVHRTKNYTSSLYCC